MSLARYLSKLGALLNSSGQVLAGGHADGSVTQAKLETLVVPLGVGQTWQNVTVSRAYGTTYTNTTGRTIAVQLTNKALSGNSSVNVFVGGVQINVISAYAVVSVNYGSLTFIVPSGATYSVTAGGSAAPDLWAELR